MIDHLGLGRMAVLLVVALVVFGPERLPEIAGQLGRFLRKARGVLDNMSSEVKSTMGPELAEMDLRSMHPKRYLADLLNDEPAPVPAAPASAPDVRPPGSGAPGLVPEAPGTAAEPPQAALAPVVPVLPVGTDAMDLLRSTEDWGVELPAEWLAALNGHAPETSDARPDGPV